MTFDDLWQQLVTKTPRLADDDAVVEIKAIKLKRLLRQFNEARAKHDAPQDKQESTGYDFLDRLFKGR